MNESMLEIHADLDKHDCMAAARARIEFRRGSAPVERKKINAMSPRNEDRWESIAIFDSSDKKEKTSWIIFSNNKWCFDFAFKNIC